MMDQPLSAFLARRLRGQAVALDFGQLIATLAARQAASPTGVAATLLSAPPHAAPTATQALVALFAGSPGWASAVGVLGGRFRPDRSVLRSATGRQEP